MQKSAQRAAWIDCARGAAILLVVLGHIDQGANPLCKWIYSFHLPLFFMLMGILHALRPSQESIRALLCKRARQLLYPYLAFSVLIAVYCLLSGKRASLLLLFRLTATLEGYNTLWFLPASFLAECIFLWIRRSRITDAAGTLGIAACTSAYALIQYYALGGGAPYEAGIVYQLGNGVARAGIGAVFMMIGASLFPVIRRQLEAMTALSGSALALLCIAANAVLSQMNGLVDLHYCVINHPVLYYLCAVLGGMGMIALMYSSKCVVKPLEYWGRNSLIIMAVHYPLPVINNAMAIGTHLNLGIQLVDHLIVLALAMGICTVLIELINRWMPWMLRIPARKRN